MLLKSTLAIFLLLLVSESVLACNQPPDKPSISEAYKSAKNVYMVFAESIITDVIPSKHERKIKKQTVIFRVLETWKGNYKVGEKLKFQTTLFDGSCGVGATNEPEWLEQEPEEGMENAARFPRISGIWLIYEDSTKYQLNMSGRTLPLELGGAADLQELYKLKQLESSH